MMIAEMDWIGWIKPFQIFRIEFTLAIGLLAACLLIASQCSIVTGTLTSEILPWLMLYVTGCLIMSTG